MTTWEAIMQRAEPMPRVSPITGKPMVYRSHEALARGCVRQAIVRQERAAAAIKGMRGADRKSIPHKLSCG